MVRVENTLENYAYHVQKLRVKNVNKILSESRLCL